MRVLLLSFAWWYLLFGPAMPIRPASGPITYVETWPCGEMGCSTSPMFVWRRVELAGPFAEQAICNAMRSAEADAATLYAVDTSACIFVSGGAVPVGSPPVVFPNGVPVTVPAPRFP